MQAWAYIIVFGAMGLWLLIQGLFILADRIKEDTVKMPQKVTKPRQENDTDDLFEVWRDTDNPYCEVCGARCEVIPVLNGYAPSNGEALYHVRLRCPNKTWCFNKHRDEVAKYLYMLPDHFIGDKELYTKDQLDAKGWRR